MNRFRCQPDPERFAKRRVSGEGARTTKRVKRLVATFCSGPLPLATRGVRVTPLALLFLFVSCASPEAGRPLGGGPGADLKNWGNPVQLHAGAQPYHDTPCVTEAVECHGPPPVFGPTPPPD
jgi:hypothetical protein